MSKSQEALDVIARYISDIRRGISRYSENVINEKLCHLKELVDKATDEKPYLDGDCDRDTDLFYTVWICPICGKEYDIVHDGKHNYCQQCGQSIDWGDFNE